MAIKEETITNMSPHRRPKKIKKIPVLEANEKVAYRVTLIIDPHGVVRWVAAYDLNVGRNVEEVLRVLDALQTDELCPCNWKQGEETLVAG